MAPQGVLRPGWVLHLAPAVVTLVTVFALGTTPGQRVCGPVNHWDKFGHFFAFGFVGITSFRALRFLLPRVALVRLVLIAVAFATAAGGLLEIWQMYVPRRQADWWDFLADGLGALLLVPAYMKITGRFE